MMHREPVIMWSFMIGGVGLAMPLVVPPIREALGYGAPTPKVPPPVRTVSEFPPWPIFWPRVNIGPCIQKGSDVCTHLPP